MLVEGVENGLEVCDFNRTAVSILHKTQDYAFVDEFKENCGNKFDKEDHLLLSGAIAHCSPKIQPHIAGVLAGAICICFEVVGQ